MSTESPRTRGRITIVILAALATLATLALTAPPAPAGPTAATKYCGEFVGPAYKQIGRPAETKYSVSVKGVTCGFAIKWMRKLAGKIVKSYGTTTTLPGPAGWRCNPGALPADWRKQAAAGLCLKGSRLFSYSPLSLGSG